MIPFGRRFALPLAILLLGAMACAGAVYLGVGPLRSASQAATIGGPFTLVAQDGRTVRDTDFLGKPFLVFFGYTHCPNVCPATLLQISDLFGKLGPDKDIAALFVTVDPERDTPAVMKDYLSSFDKRILGLSGDRSAVDAVMRAYRVYAKKVPLEGDDYSMDHTAIVYLMDKQGRFVNAVNLEQPVADAAHEVSAYL